MLIRLLLPLLLLATSARAEEYHLFNPVPDNQLREMSTERPSRSDSAITVDAGHAQLEIGALGYLYNDDRIGGEATKSRELTFGQSATARLGLTENSEVQAIADLYRDRWDKDADSNERIDGNGLGDLTLRYKYSFAGNDGSPFSIAALPFVILPTAGDDLSDRHVEYGFALPLGFDLGGGVNLGAETIVSLLREQDGPGDWYGEYTNILLLGTDVTDRLNSYVELYTSLADTAERHWENTLDVGAVYQLTDHMTLDSGVNFGISEAADDFALTFGGAYRF